MAAVQVKSRKLTEHINYMIGFKKKVGRWRGEKRDLTIRLFFADKS